jgi:ribosome-associated protein
VKKAAKAAPKKAAKRGAKKPAKKPAAKPAKKAAKKPAKKAARKPAKRAPKKVAKKVAKKPVKSAAKKAARKPAKRAPKKVAKKAAKKTRSIEPDYLARSRELLALVQASLDDDKAEEVAVIELAGKSTIADFMVVATGRSSRQVGAMAQHLRTKLKTAGVKGISIEGAARADWVLIDGGDIIVHLFRPEVRAFYRLEKMWSEELATPGAE